MPKRTRSTSNWSVTKRKRATNSASTQQSKRPKLQLVPYVNLKSNSNAIFGDVFATRLQYFDGPYTVNPGIGGAYATQSWVLSGLYDPDYTGGGHQPYGFDQLMNLYNRYYVRRACIEVHIWNSDTSHGQQCVLNVSNSAVPSGDLKVEIEAGNAEFKTLANSNGGPAAIVMRKYVDISKFLGEYGGNDSTCMGDVTSNPARSVFCHLNITSADGTDSSPCYAYAFIKFDAEFKYANLGTAS